MKWLYTSNFYLLPSFHFFLFFCNYQWNRLNSFSFLIKNFVFNFHRSFTLYFLFGMCEKMVPVNTSHIFISLKVQTLTDLWPPKLRHCIKIELQRFLWVPSLNSIFAGFHYKIFSLSTLLWNKYILQRSIYQIHNLLFFSGHSFLHHFP